MTAGLTITVMHNRVGGKARFNGIDCPGEAAGVREQSQTGLIRAGIGKTMTVEVVDYDRYKRTVGEVKVPDGRLLNNKLLRDGICWGYRKYAPDERLARAEKEARLAQRGD